MRRAILALLTMLLIGTALPANADPIGDKRREAERIARELEAQGRRVSVLAEEFNLARLEAERVEARVGAAAAEVAETKAKADAAKGRLRDQAVEAYVTGGAAPAVSLLIESATVDDL